MHGTLRFAEACAELGKGVQFSSEAGEEGSNAPLRKLKFARKASITSPVIYGLVCTNGPTFRVLFVSVWLQTWRGTSYSLDPAGCRGVPRGSLLGQTDICG
jgi:hypothetical protein